MGILDEFGRSRGGGKVDKGRLPWERPPASDDVEAIETANKPPDTKPADLGRMVAGYRDMERRMVNKSDGSEAGVAEARERARKSSLADIYYRQLVAANQRSADTRNPVGDIPERERHGVMRDYVPMGEATREATSGGEPAAVRRRRQWELAGGQEGALRREQDRERRREEALHDMKIRSRRAAGIR